MSKPKHESKPVPVKINTELKGCPRKIFSDGWDLAAGECALPGHDGDHVVIERRR